MTEQHPLTNESCDQITSPDHNDLCQALEETPTKFFYKYEDMRALYDLAVDKAVDEFSHALYAISQIHKDTLDKQDISDLVREFQEAMRPTTTQEDN